MKRITAVLFFLQMFFSVLYSQKAPLRLAIAGVTHDHLAEVSRRINRKDFHIVGVAEANPSYRQRNALTGKVDASLFYADLEEMLDATKPEAVAAYGSISEHLSVVEACAPRGIHVMVEKPLATTVGDALRIERLAKKYGIKVLTNYETTWYSANWHIRQLVEDQQLGDIFRMNIYDGHEGPREIGCSAKFLEWLTDPVKNGGGAVIDFGCYGANISTWLLKGQQPKSVYAVLHTHKPHNYPLVDDVPPLCSNTLLPRYRLWRHGAGRKGARICISTAIRDMPTRRLPHSWRHTYSASILLSLRHLDSVHPTMIRSDS